MRVAVCENCGKVMVEKAEGWIHIHCDCGGMEAEEGSPMKVIVAVVEEWNKEQESGTFGIEV